MSPRRLLWDDRAGAYLPAPEDPPTVAELERILAWCRTQPTQFPGAIADFERELARRRAAAQGVVP